jgi:hypothetical protein
MLTQIQINKLVERNNDYRVDPGLMTGPKYYYLFYKGSDELVKELTNLVPYAPHWHVNDGVLCTSKMVYATILSEYIVSRGCSVDIVYGQIVP